LMLTLCEQDSRHEVVRPRLNASRTTGSLLESSKHRLLIRRFLKLFGQSCRISEVVHPTYSQYYLSAIKTTFRRIDPKLDHKADEPQIVLIGLQWGNRLVESMPFLR
jgi:hypothetical protein